MMSTQMREAAGRVAERRPERKDAGGDHRAERAEIDQLPKSVAVACRAPAAGIVGDEQDQPDADRPRSTIQNKRFIGVPSDRRRRVRAPCGCGGFRGAAAARPFPAGPAALP